MNKENYKYLFFRYFGKYVGIEGKGHYHFQSLTSPTPLLPPSEYRFDPIKGLKNIDVTDHEKVIYICSPTQRSGTNYLCNIMNLCSEVYFPGGDQIPNEQFLYSYADVLSDYLKLTVGNYTRWIDTNDHFCQVHRNLMAGVGDGFIKTFSGKRDKTLLLRTPDTGNIEYFFNLFPNGKLVVIIRDGRDTVDSFIKSFAGDWAFSKMCKRWAARVDKLHEVMDKLKIEGIDDRILLVRYEDLNSEPKAPVENILSFLGLDKDSFDWDKLDKIPVLGSSTVHEKPHLDFWKPSTKNDSAAFSQKWKKWTPGKIKKFKRMAGKQLIKAGYEDNLDW